MSKYYWYITVKPETESFYEGNLPSMIKRSIDQPPNNLFYLMETIDGYNHTVKDKNNAYPPMKMNDFGKPSVIRSISQNIIERLIDQWSSQNRKYTAIKEEEKERKQKEYVKRQEAMLEREERELDNKDRSRLNPISDFNPLSYSSDPMSFSRPFGSTMSLAVSRRKKLKKSSKIKVNRKVTCKCTRPVRRVKK